MNGFSHNVLSNVFFLVKLCAFLILFHGAGFFRYNHPSKEKRCYGSARMIGKATVDTKHILLYNNITTLNFRIYHRAHTSCRRYAVSPYLKSPMILRLGVVTLRNGMLTGVVLERERHFFIYNCNELFKTWIIFTFFSKAIGNEMFVFYNTVSYRIIKSRGL